MKATSRADRPTLAVILPTLNEEAHLPAALESLLGQSEPAERILVVDGGSSDETMAVVRAAGLSLLAVPSAGRGGQIAAGVSQCQEDVVLVAHADACLAVHALETVREHLARHSECPGGCLGHRFRSPRWIYRVIEWFDRRRAKAGISYGDQVQFFRRHLLERVGGFPDQPILEDFELSRRLCRLGRPAYLDLPVIVSPRRFERYGVPRTVMRNLWYRWKYRLGGVSACREIHRRYYGG